MECRSASCGTCWVGVMGGAEKLSDVPSAKEKQIKNLVTRHCRAQALIRLACQARPHVRLGRYSSVNGVFGNTCASKRRWIGSGTIGGTQMTQWVSSPDTSIASETCSARLLPFYGLSRRHHLEHGRSLIKWTSLSGLDSFGTFLLARLPSIFPRGGRVSGSTGSLVGVFALCGTVSVLFWRRRETTAANAIFLQYTAPLYV